MPRMKLEDTPQISIARYYIKLMIQYLVTKHLRFNMTASCDAYESLIDIEVKATILA